MHISTIKYLESLPGYTRELDGSLERATMYGIGHERSTYNYTPTIEQVDKCLAWLEHDDSIIDPHSYTLELIGGEGTVEEQHAAKLRNNHGARQLLEQLRSHLHAISIAAAIQERRT